MPYGSPYTPPGAFHGFIEPGSRQTSFATQSSVAPPSLMSQSRSSTGIIEGEIKRPSRFPFRKQKTVVEAAQPRVINASPAVFGGFPPSTPPKDFQADGSLIRGLGLGTSPPERPPLDVSRVSSVSTSSSYSVELDHPESDPFFDPWKDTSSPREALRESPSYPQRHPFAPDTIPEHTSPLCHGISQSSGQSWIPNSARPSSASKRSSQASDNSLQLSTMPSIGSTRLPSQSTGSAQLEAAVAQLVIQPRTTGGLREYLPAEENDFAGFCNGKRCPALYFINP